LIEIFIKLKKQNKNVSLIISDWDMPHTDGVVACKAICKLEEENKYEKCFKVIITGNTFFKSDEIDSK